MGTNVALRSKLSDRRVSATPKSQEEFEGSRIPNTINAEAGD